MSSMDTALTIWVNVRAGHLPVADQIMIWISILGVPALILLVAIQWWVPRRDRPARHVVVSAGLSFLLGLALNQVILLFVQRVRPYDSHVTRLLIERSADPSFPSDHATASFAIAVAFLIHRSPQRGLIFLALAILIAVSRVYVGTHYLGDVVGGAATGILAACLVRVTYRPDTWVDRAVTGIL